MVVAGEVSGDMHAARIVREIKKRAPDVEFSGMGSSRMAKEGVEILVDPLEISSIGFSKPLKNFNIHRKHLRILKRRMKSKNPDVILLVDYSGFNMLMAREAAKLDIPVVSCFPPSAWVWGKWRARWMARYGAVIASVLPMERDVYRQVGAEVNFVGHPLLDIIEDKSNKIDNEQISNMLEINKDNKVVGLLPGSRKAEIKHLLPPMMSAAEMLKRSFPELQFIIPLADEEHREYVGNIAGQHSLVVKIVKDLTYEVMDIADFLVLASGTAALEAAIKEKPMVITYKTDYTTHKLGKFLVKTDYIGLPNIIARNEILPELVQDEVTAENICNEVEKMLKRPYLLKTLRDKLRKIKEQLGKRGATGRIAEIVLNKGEIKYGE